MRKYLVIALTLFTTMLFGGVAFAIDLPNEPGMIKRMTGTSQDTTTRVYKLVRNSSANHNQPSMSADLLVVYDTNSDDGVSVRVTTTSGDGAIAGIIVTTIPTSDAVSGTSAADDAGRRNWGYMLVHGVTTVNISDGSNNGALAGERFITSNDAGGACTFAHSSYATLTGFQDEEQGQTASLVGSSLMTLLVRLLAGLVQFK